MNDDETKNESEIAENKAEEDAAAAAEEDQQDSSEESDDAEFDLAGPNRLVELENQVEELTDKLLRAVAETENVRRRTSREKEDASKYAIAGFAADMVSVADNLTRALGSIDAETRTANEAVETLMAGVEMTLRDLLNTFEKTGIKQIEAMDQPFDHNLHEALFEMEDPDKPAGTVVQIVQQGYTLRDRLLRPTKVGVAKGGPKAVAPSTPEDPVASEDATPENAPEQTRAYEQGAEGPGAHVDEEL